MRFILHGGVSLGPSESDAAWYRGDLHGEALVALHGDRDASHQMSARAVTRCREVCAPLLARQGLRRWVLPVELGLDALAELQQRRPDDVETEVFAFGRLPLAWSARCYTARSDNLPKDDCRFRCLDHPDGRLLRTREDEEFLVLNGTQTLSARSHQALDAYADLQRLGVDALRISPQSDVTLAVLALMDEARGGGDPHALAARLDDLLPGGACTGYLHGRPGMDDGHSHAA